MVSGRMLAAIAILSSAGLFGVLIAEAPWMAGFGAAVVASGVWCRWLDRKDVSL